MFGGNAKHTRLSIFDTKRNIGDLKWKYRTEYIVES